MKDWLAPEGGRIVLAAFALLGVAAGNAFLPVVIVRAVDHLNPDEARLLYWAPLIVLPVIGVKALCGFFGSGLIEKIAQETILRLRRALFHAVTASDMARLSADRSGALASRFVSDMNVVRDAMARALRNLAVDLFSVLGLFAAMLYIDWLLTLTALGALALGGAPIVAIGARLRRISADVQGRLGLMTAFLAEHFAAARLVKTHRLEARQESRAAAAFEDLRDMQMTAAWSRAKIEPIMEVLGAIAICGVLALAAYFVGSGRAAIGDFAGFIAAVLLAAQHARRIGTLHVAVQEGAAALERVFDALDAAPTIVDAPGAIALKDPRGEVRFENVRFIYAEADAPALTGLSLRAAPGETLALVGPSGAGKSTVFNLIVRLHDAQAGRVLVDGRDVRDLTLASLRDAVAFVAQDVTLLDDTIRANIAFGRPGASDAAIAAAARAAQAEEFIARCPHGFDTEVGERGMTLSGGQRQRIALARAILKDAPILLLDEATSALDPESERAVQAALDAARRGRTTIIIAHRLSTVRSADRILVLDRGRVVEEGRHEDLCARGGLYAKLAGADFAG